MIVNHPLRKRALHRILHIIEFPTPNFIDELFIQFDESLPAQIQNVQHLLLRRHIQPSMVVVINPSVQPYNSLTA
jgi:hypothetical protein